MEPSDEALTETLKTLIISHKSPMTAAQLKSDFENLEGRDISEHKLNSLLKFNNIFHLIRPSGGPELFDVRFDVRARMMNRQKSQICKFNPVSIQKSLKNPKVPRNKVTINNNNSHQKNFNEDKETFFIDLRQKLNHRETRGLSSTSLLRIPKLTMGLSERLKKKGELSPEDIKAANAVKITEEWHSSSGNSLDKLIKYCQQQKIDPPEVKFLNNPLAKGSFKSQISINGKVYMAYKDFFQSKIEAQEASCKVAVEEIKREEELSQNPFDISSDEEIVKKIWTMIRHSTGGVFIKHITSLYIENFKLSLPENWHQLIKRYESSLFSFETNAFNEPIIFAVGDAEKNMPTTVMYDEQQIAELEFPWGQKLWNVFITSATSTNDICARLIGPEFSDALDKLLIEIEISMLSNKHRPKKIHTNQIYLTSIAECFHRIRVVKMDGHQAECICIDNGDYEWISYDEIFVCKPEFLNVAPQAFKLSLFGLESFENDPNVSEQQIFEPLVFKSFVGEVMTDKETWDNNKSRSIQFILYDTSSDEDINLNENLMNSILKSIPTPVLSQKENNQVIITSINEDAICCQLAKSSVYIQQLINNISKSDLLNFKGLYTDTTDKKKNYLVYDAKQKNWFRARMERKEGDSHLMYYIDHGYKTIVSTENIYRLDKVSMVLYFYPPQVLMFGLFNIQLTHDVRKRLLAMLPRGRQALAKVISMGNGNLPHVHLFTYIKHNKDSVMIKINDQFDGTLGTELDTHSSNDPLIKIDQRKLKNNGEFINIHVILVASPQSFVIRLQDDVAELNSLLTLLQTYCNNRKTLSSLSELSKGEYYGVFDEDTGTWIRASTENIIDKDFIHCYCIDSGNFKTLSLDKIRHLPNQFRKIPKIAMKAKLYGVKPRNKDFTPDDALYFKKLTEDKNFPAVIKNVTSDPFDMELYEIVLFGKDAKIHEILIHENRALPL